MTNLETIEELRVRLLNTGFVPVFMWFVSLSPESKDGMKNNPEMIPYFEGGFVVLHELDQVGQNLLTTTQDLLLYGHIKARQIEDLFDIIDNQGQGALLPVS